MPLFRWEDIDHRLVVLKLVDLSEEMGNRIKADERRIRFENRLNLNSNTVPSLVLQIKEKCANEWARRAYEIYCEVWQTQGYVKSAPFVRGVCAHIVRMLGVRANSIAHEFSRSARGTNLPVSLRTAHLNGLDLRMRQLQSRWKRRLEIEAKECAHAERRKNLEAIPTSSPENQDHTRIALHPGNVSPSANKAPSQARFPHIRSSAPLSDFEETVGKLMVQARRGCSTKYLPRTEISKIAAFLDQGNLPVRSNLERKAAQTMAVYNQSHSRAAIKTWKSASGHPQFKSAVRKRFSRAEEKYKKATPPIAAPSAGTPRTTI